MRAKVYHYRERDPSRQTPGGSGVPKGYDPSGTPLRAPRQRWSSPRYKMSKEALKKEREKWRRGMAPEPSYTQRSRERERIERFGKRRGFAIDVLDRAGGTTKVVEVAAEMGVKRPRDLVRRKTTDKGRDGLLWMLARAGVIWISEDLEWCGLTEDWLEALANDRARGQESTVNYDMPVMRHSYTAPDETLNANGMPEPETGPHRVVIKGEDDIRAIQRRLGSLAYHRRGEPPERSGGTEAGRENIARSHKAKVDYEPPAREPTSERERKIRRLVDQGMSERWARGSEGGVGLAPPRAKPHSPTSVPLVDGIYQHGAECDCEWCA